MPWRILLNPAVSSPNQNQCDSWIGDLILRPTVSLSENTGNSFCVNLDCGSCRKKIELSKNFKVVSRPIFHADTKSALLFFISLIFARKIKERIASLVYHIIKITQVHKPPKTSSPGA
jgi:hypothetical protein